jgi:hypothetical protein
MAKAPNTYRMLLFQLSHEPANTLCCWGRVLRLLRTLPSRIRTAAGRTAAFPFPVLHSVLSLRVFKKNVRKKNITAEKNVFR